MWVFTFIFTVNCGSMYYGLESVNGRERTEITEWFKLAVTFEPCSYSTVLLRFLKFIFISLML